MRQGWKRWIAAIIPIILLTAPELCRAVSCTMQAELSSQNRNTLAAIGGRLATAVVQQDLATLHAALLPAASSEWNTIQSVVEDSAPLVKGGRIELRNLFLLDSTDMTEPGSTQFFCSNSSGSLTVTMTMRALPPGRYAVILARAPGAALNAQIAIILVWDATGSSPGWKLGGLTVRPGSLDGHSGVWYWERARVLAKEGEGWSAWYSYDIARSLLVPVDFLTSPNLEKLDKEKENIRNSPQNAFPYSVPDGQRTWKIDSIHIDETLLHADLRVVYESTGVTDPAARHTEAIAVMSALLKARPGLRENFHGLWAYSKQDGKSTPVIELPMSQIP